MLHDNNSFIYSGADPNRVAKDLATLVDFQEKGISIESLKKIIEENLIPHLMHYDRPEFQSMFNTFPEEGAELGSKIALSYNQGVTNWQVSPGGAMLEELCCRALCRLFGFGKETEATFMYSGTYANQQAVYLALHRYAEKQGFNFAEHGLHGFGDSSRLCILASRDAHFSIKHAVRILGLGDKSIVCLDMDQNHRIDVHNLKQTIERIKKDREIFCIIATAGTTSTGAVDPVENLVKICKNDDIWIHVDGAYGFAYSLIPEWKHLFAGVDLADSVCWDPHKQMGVPIPNSLLFVRNWTDFRRMAIHASYFNRDEKSEPNPGLKSPPSTRPMSALSLVTSLRSLGIQRVVKRLRAPLEAIRKLYEYCKKQPDIEVCHEPDTGILCLRVIPDGLPEDRLNKLQEMIYNKIQKVGKRSISITRLNGKQVLRLLAISPNVTIEALIETVNLVRQLAEEFK